MKLSISNIAWPQEWDGDIYAEMIRLGFRGLEIAPTRIIPAAPYDDADSIAGWYEGIRNRFEISSMQSIWNGRSEKIFGSPEEREVLLEYTKKAVRFADRIGCGNMVFGCPCNRRKPEGASERIAIDFFREIGAYAYKHKTAIGVEANPPIYNTNWLNTTEEVLSFIETVHSEGVLLNLDLGAMIENGEPLEILNGKQALINHIHISEPGLKKIVRRDIHRELKSVLVECGYKGYVSVEMSRQESQDDILDTMKYIGEVMH